MLPGKKLYQLSFLYDPEFSLGKVEGKKWDVALGHPGCGKPGEAALLFIPEKQEIVSLSLIILLG